MQSVAVFVTTIPVASLTFCVQLPAESPGAVTGTAIAGVGEIKLKLVVDRVATSRNRERFGAFRFLDINFTALF